MRPAIASRRLQFVAGPDQHTFYACPEHREKLEHGDVMCFYRYQGEPVRDLPVPEEGDEIECDFCREG